MSFLPLSWQMPQYRCAWLFPTGHQGSLRSRRQRLSYTQRGHKAGLSFAAVKTTGTGDRGCQSRAGRMRDGRRERQRIWEAGRREDVGGIWNEIEGERWRDGGKEREKYK